MDNSPGMTLLDEVEDGINSSNMEMFCEFISELTEKCKHQFLITTQSSVLLDFIKPDMIRWIYRDQNGAAKCLKFNSSETMKKRLSFLNPYAALSSVDDAPHRFASAGKFQKTRANGAAFSEKRWTVADWRVFSYGQDRNPDPLL